MKKINRVLGLFFLITIILCSCTSSLSEHRKTAIEDLVSFVENNKKYEELDNIDEIIADFKVNIKDKKSLSEINEYYNDTVKLIKTSHQALVNVKKEEHLNTLNDMLLYLDQSKYYKALGLINEFEKEEFETVSEVEEAFNNVSYLITLEDELYNDKLEMYEDYLRELYLFDEDFDDEEYLNSIYIELLSKSTLEEVEAFYITIIGEIPLAQKRVIDKKIEEIITMIDTYKGFLPNHHYVNDILLNCKTNVLEQEVNSISEANNIYSETYSFLVDFNSNLIINYTEILFNQMMDGINFANYTPLKQEEVLNTVEEFKSLALLQTNINLVDNVYEDYLVRIGGIETIGELEPTNDIILTINTYPEGVNLIFDGANPLEYKVKYRLLGTSTFNDVDQELIRKYDDNKTVCDILGLKEGKYTIMVFHELSNTSGSEIVEIKALDRSGYAHFNYSGTIGAYNNDGTLISNADVIYVSEANKNTVVYKSYVGIGDILKNASKFNNPIVIRVLGKIQAPQYIYKLVTPRVASKSYSESELAAHFSNTLEDIEDINNIVRKYTIETSKTVNNGGKTVYDDDSYFNMIDISKAKNITVEGVGEDAEFYQFGLHFKECNNIEVRNLTFTDYPEDACSFTGNSSNPLNTGRIFVHHNVFNKGKNNWDLTGEQDKGDGDGATDVSQSSNVTLSYNKYYKCKKTGLVGGSDSTKQFNYTYHHNYYKEASSRLPLIRDANLHMYNNFFDSISSTCMDARTKTYIFSEANYFQNSKNVMRIRDDAKIKSYLDIFSGCSGDNKGTVVDKRETIVSNKNLYGPNFDTNSAVFYYNDVFKKTNVSYLTDAQTAKSDALVLSGTYLKK